MSQQCAAYDDTCGCPACEADRDEHPLEVTFRTLNTESERTVRFDLGSRRENNDAALVYAWKNNANIVDHRFVPVNA